jgi:hypothetical protein
MIPFEDSLDKHGSNDGTQLVQINQTMAAVGEAAQKVAGESAESLDLSKHLNTAVQKFKIG